MELKKNKYVIETRRKPFSADEQIDGFYGSYRRRERLESRLMKTVIWQRVYQSWASAEIIPITEPRSQHAQAK